MNNSGQEQINSHNCSEQSPFPNKSLCHKIQDIITNIVLYQVETQVNRVELLLESGTASMSIRKDRMVGASSVGYTKRMNHTKIHSEVG